MVSKSAGSEGAAAETARRRAWSADLGDGRYRNPIIHADYSDPDAIVVGSDFFMVSSSFASAPGLPLLHSKDLVNWRIANHVIDRLGWPGYDLPAHGKGVWAPSLRFHNGFFYVYFASPDEGVFMAKTDDPFSRWESPVCVKRAIGWIDPCPFWDEDGRAYLVNAFAASRIGFKSVLRLNRLSADGTEVLAEGRFIFDGQDRHVTMEGPKMYKRNGWYYIFAPAGGVKNGWQTILRSKTIFGPYEDKIVLHQGATAVNGPHQGAFVETAAGDSWFLHFQDKGAYGRVVHLQPMTWNFDWPLIGVDIDNDGIGEPVEIWRKPATALASSDPTLVSSTTVKPPTAPADESFNLADSDDFRSSVLGRQWQWQADPENGWYALDPFAGRLRLFSATLPKTEKTNLLDYPRVLTQKFPAPDFRMEVKLHSISSGVNAGLVVLGDDYFGLALRRTATAYELVFLQGGTRWDGRARPDLSRKRHEESVVASITGILNLGLTVRENCRCRFYYRLADSDIVSAGPEFSARPGLWVGAKIGIFCLAVDNRDEDAVNNLEQSFADFGAVAVTGI